jgi:hypothetical protein
VQKLLKWKQYRYELGKWKGTKMENNAQRENRENTIEKKIHRTSGMKEVSDNTTATKNLYHYGRTQLGT